MELNTEAYRNAARLMNAALSGSFGPATRKFASWLDSRRIPNDLIDVFKEFSPKHESWLGAGSFFDEQRIMSWNEDMPEALLDGLLIIGSACNGDHIAIDILNGNAGYICHEADWRKGGPRKSYVSINNSFGGFVKEVNNPEAGLPSDYWEAMSYQNGR